MTKQYYEAHVTMVGEPAVLRPLVEALKWKFSAIDGDANLGDGIKCYATRQMNKRIGDAGALSQLTHAADQLEAQGANVIRRKVEMVLYDDRSALVRPCEGGCVECHLDDIPESRKIA